MSEKVKKAIDYIEECLHIHEQWIEYQSDDSWIKDIEPTDVGGPEHHKKWVEKYELVLEVLNDR